MTMIMRLLVVCLKALVIGLITIAYKVGLEVVKMLFKAKKAGTKMTDISVMSVVDKTFNKEKGSIL